MDGWLALACSCAHPDRAGGVDRCTPLPKTQGEDHGEAVKSVMQKGFLGRDTEQLFPYGIYTCVRACGRGADWVVA